MTIRKTIGYTLIVGVAALFAFLVGSPAQVGATYNDSDYKKDRDSRTRSWSRKSRSGHSHKKDYSYRSTHVDIKIDHSYDSDSEDTETMMHKHHKKHEPRVRSVSRTERTPRTPHGDRCCNCCKVCDEPDVLGDDTDDEEEHDGQGGYDEPADESADDPEEEPEQTALELRIDQKVKVDGGEYVDAETDETSPEGAVGGGALWQITVSADEADPDESRDIKVQWQPPANVDPSGYDASSGSYDGSEWIVSIADLPAILTVSSTINGTGLGASTATISHIACTSALAVDGFCDFTDNVNTNNSNPAGLLAIQTADPGGTVLGATTGGQVGDGTGQVLGSDSGAVLAETGQNMYMTIAIGVMVASLPLALRRKPSL